MSAQTVKQRGMSSKQRRNSYRFVSEVLGGSCTSQDLATDLQAVVNELSNAIEERVPPTTTTHKLSNTWDVKPPSDDYDVFSESFLDEMIPSVMNDHQKLSPLAPPSSVEAQKPSQNIMDVVKTEPSNGLTSCCFADSLSNVQVKTEPIDLISTQTCPQRPTMLPLSHISTPALGATDMSLSTLQIPQSSAPLSCPDFHTMSLLADEDSQMSCFSLPRLSTDTGITPSPSTPHHPQNVTSHGASSVPSGHFSSVRMCSSLNTTPMDTDLKPFLVDTIKTEPDTPIEQQDACLSSSLIPPQPATSPGSQPTSPSTHSSAQSPAQQPTSVAAPNPSYVSPVTPTILTLPGGSVTLAVSPPSISIIKPINILPAPTKPLQPGQISVRHRTGPRITAFNTHPGCTTIKYNRKNNPDLEKRRIHYCDFPGTYIIPA